MAHSYKMRQIILQNTTAILLKCNKSLLQNASGFLLQDAAVLLQNAAVVTKCVNILTNFDNY